MRRAEEGISALPGGREMCRRIWEAMQAPVPPSSAHAVWLQLGFAIVHCTSFPFSVFSSLRSSDDFDIRWPLTFTCWYWSASGDSVDRVCVQFLRRNGLL